MQYQFKTIMVLLLSLILSCQETPVQKTVDNKVIVDWNNIGYNIANKHDQFYSFTGVRALTMVHIAMHDALNAIEPEYEFYSYNERQPKADPTVASSQAAFQVLMEIYPQRKDTLEIELSKWLSTIADSEAKTLGIELGKKSAASILALRTDDGYDKNGNYVPVVKPGAYQYTPGFNWVWIPDLVANKPFTLASSAQFRSSPPPDLTSKEYADAYNEVLAFGRTGSQLRNQDQTNYAHWWAEFGEHGWNRIGRITAAQQALPLKQTARMFVMVNMYLYDLYLASFESKYYYNTWRPYTAIHNGDADNNSETVADSDWMPEMVTPPWPEYPSAHAAVAAGEAEIVSHVFGTSEISFTMESVSALPNAKVRTYHNVNTAANDCAESRIMNGFHFRFATEAGKKQGREVAKHIIENYLRRL